MKKQKYSPLLKSPYYAQTSQADASESGAVLHRYLDDQFMARFTQQAQNNQLQSESFNWIVEDRFEKHNHPTLRLPIHRTFYVLCCEAVCNAPGQPALDATRIDSAGFVIRQKNAGEEYHWMVRDGIDKGWELKANSSIEEPDENRYLLNKGYIQARSPEPAYSGEQTYPLSALPVQDTSSKPVKKHNLLYGFMSLGGQSYPSAKSVNQPALKNVLSELIWPLGEFEKSAWNEHSGHFIKSGKIEQAGAELFSILFERFHILDIENTDNAELIRFLDTIQVQYFDTRWSFLDEHNPMFSQVFYQMDNFQYINRTQSLIQFLKENTSAIENWLMKYHKADGNLNEANTENKKAENNIDENLHLILSEDQAADLRLLIARRSLQTIELALSDLPEPRYQREALYFVKTFLRYRDEKGCEKIIWGESSLEFHVAAPFDPQASRPHLIQMPGLEDIKRGLANGAAMRLPKSLADVVEKIKPDLGDPGERDQNNRNDGGWIYVFSIPILTICAMILLMIVVSLLNFIFRWIPWVIQRIPVPK